MPISHITLRKGHSNDYLDAVSNSLHEALVATFDVPEEDRFQIFHPVDPVSLRFDRDYQAGPRSVDWMLIEITAGKPRSIETKQKFYLDLSKRLAASTGLLPADVMVVIRQNQAEDWSFGNGIATLVEKGES